VQRREYLRVRGNLRTYRIHLGSSNILMAPNEIEDRSITAQIRAAR
jgi:hypothetical protein